jgi:hypothetical protein
MPARAGHSLPKSLQTTSSVPFSLWFVICWGGGGVCLHSVDMLNPIISKLFPVRVLCLVLLDVRVFFCGPSECIPPFVSRISFQRLLILLILVSSFVFSVHLSPPYKGIDKAEVL